MTTVRPAAARLKTRPNSFFAAVAVNEGASTGISPIRSPTPRRRAAGRLMSTSTASLAEMAKMINTNQDQCRIGALRDHHTIYE
jgi:hypothetical protein